MYKCKFHACSTWCFFHWIMCGPKKPGHSPQSVGTSRRRGRKNERGCSHFFVERETLFLRCLSFHPSVATNGKADLSWLLVPLTGHNWPLLLNTGYNWLDYCCMIGALASFSASHVADAAVSFSLSVCEIHFTLLLSLSFSLSLSHKSERVSEWVNNSPIHLYTWTVTSYSRCLSVFTQLSQCWVGQELV